MRYIDTIRKCEWYFPAYSEDIPNHVEEADDSHSYLYFELIKVEFELWMDERAKDAGYKSLSRMSSYFGSGRFKADAVKAHKFRDDCWDVLIAAQEAYENDGTETTLKTIIAACPSL